MDLITMKQNLDRAMAYLNDCNKDNKQIAYIVEEYFKVRKVERKHPSETCWDCDKIETCSFSCDGCEDYEDCLICIQIKREAKEKLEAEDGQ